MEWELQHFYALKFHAVVPTATITMATSHGFYIRVWTRCSNCSTYISKNQAKALFLVQKASYLLSHNHYKVFMALVGEGELQKADN